MDAIRYGIKSENGRSANPARPSEILAAITELPCRSLDTVYIRYIYSVSRGRKRSQPGHIPGTLAQISHGRVELTVFQEQVSS